jgi:hypothetical protein
VSIVAAVLVHLLQAGDERMIRVEFENPFPNRNRLPEARYMRASAGVMSKVSVIRQAGDSVRRVDNSTSLTRSLKVSFNQLSRSCYRLQRASSGLRCSVKDVPCGAASTDSMV